MKILNELIRLINAVPAGGRIDGHIYNITVTSVAQALKNAHDRGVTVKLSGDGQLATNTSTAMSYLNALPLHQWCASSTSHSCVSSASGGISHTKLFTFSSTTTPAGVRRSNVSWFGSANLTYATGAQTFNNTVTVYGDPTLYTRFNTYLDDLYDQSPRTNDYYKPSINQGYINATTASVHASPELETDLVVRQLEEVTPNSSCRVRVMHASIRDSRMEVVDRLTAMKARGCLVWVVSTNVEARPLAAFKAAGIPVRSGPSDVHDKAIMIYGKYGSAYRYRVYTGSHNLSQSANSAYDEILVKMAAESTNTTLYSAFVRHFEDAYNFGTAY